MKWCFFFKVLDWGHFWKKHISSISLLGGFKNPSLHHPSKICLGYLFFRYLQANTWMNFFRVFTSWILVSNLTPPSWNVNFNTCNFHLERTTPKNVHESISIPCDFFSSGRNVWNKTANLFPLLDLIRHPRCRTLRELAAHVTTMWGHSWGW